MHLGKRLTSLIDVIDRANNLANLLLILVFVLNLILEVELERLVLPRDVLNLLLQFAHITLLHVQLFVKVFESLPLLLLDLLHALVDGLFTDVELLVFVFQIGETVFQRVNRILLAIIDILVV